MREFENKAQAVKYWNDHNFAGHPCWLYMTGKGTECPANKYRTLREFLEAAGFLVSKNADRIYGQELDSPNFRHENVQPEFPVRISTQKPKSPYQEIPVVRETSQGVHPTDEVLARRAERAQNPSYGITLPSPESDAIERLEYRVASLEDVVVNRLIEVRERLDALEKEAAAAKQQASKPKVSISIDTEAFHDDIGAVEELAAELDKRITRILARRGQHSDDC